MNRNTQYTYLYMWTYFFSYGYLLYFIRTSIVQFITMYILIALRANSTWGDSQANHIRHYQYIQKLYLICECIFPDPEIWVSLQLKLICYFRCNVLKGNRCARYSLEADPIQRQPRQLADFHLPLHEAVLSSISVDTEKQKPLFLFIITVICI